MDLNYEIRPMGINDIEGKAYVHHKAYLESYSDIFSKDYLKRQSLEHCINMAKKYPLNTYVLEDKNINKIVGFLCINNEGDIGEIVALYTLEEYKGKGVGKALMEFGLNLLKDKSLIELFVLSENKRAINFYKKYGFIKQDESPYKKDLDIKVMKMVLYNNIKK